MGYPVSSFSFTCDIPIQRLSVADNPFRSGVTIFQKITKQKWRQGVSLPPVMRRVLMYIFLCVFQISSHDSTKSYDCPDGSHYSV